ncbi:MAG: hypothetical protein WD431_04050 [Cyclobacteriaceae bacterium]
MQLDFDWINILILFGAIQGLVFMGILLFHRKHPGRVFLGLVMVVLVYNALETLNWSSGRDKYILFFEQFPYVTIFLICPAFYLYFKTLLIPGFVPNQREILLLFSPFLFQFSFSAINKYGTSYNHHGGTSGTQNWLFIFPDHQLGISIITNQSGPKTPNLLSKTVKRILKDIIKV